MADLFTLKDYKDTVLNLDNVAFMDRHSMNNKRHILNVYFINGSVSRLIYDCDRRRDDDVLEMQRKKGGS